MIVVNEKRESAQIIQFPPSARLNARRQQTDVIDARIADALDPAWYHVAAMRDAEKKPTN